MFALDLFNTKYERKLQEGAVDNSEAYQDKKSRLTEEAQALHAGDPVVVTAPNEFEGATGEIHELSPSGSFVVVDLYNHGRHSMHLSDVAYNDYADQEEEDDWYDEEMEEGLGNWMGKVADKAFGPGSPAEISGFAGDKAYAQHYETRAYPEAIQMIAQGGGIGQQRTNANVARAERQLQQIYRDKGVELTKQNYAQLVTNKIKADVAKAMGQQGIAENSERVDPILIKALNNMPDGLNSHGQVLNAAYDAYAMELGKMRMKSEYGTTNVYVPKLMGLYKDKHGLTFNEAETLSNPQHKLGKDIDAGRKSDEASRIRADKARAEFNKQWDEKKATEKPGVEEAGEWPDKMSHDDLENMQRNHQKWSEQDTPSRTDPSATVEDFYHEVVRLGPGLGRDLLYFAAEEGDEPPHIVKAARQLYKKIARKAGLNPEIGSPDNNKVFDLMYDWVGKNYSNPGEQGVAEGIFDRFKKTPKKESYSRQDFYQWLDKVQEQLASGEDIDEVIYNLELSLEKIYTDDVVAQFKGQIWDSLDLEMHEQGVAEGAGEQWMIYQDFGRGELVPYPHLPKRPFNTEQQAIRWITAMNPDWRDENISIDTVEPGRLYQPGVAEAQTDYQKRRQRERDIDAGRPVKPLPRNPQTDYAKKRAKDKRDMELGEVLDTPEKKAAYIKANANDQVQHASHQSFKSGQAGDKYNKSDAWDHRTTRREKGMDRALRKLGEESSTDSEAVERAILNRIMVAHTDLLMQFGPQKVMQAAEEVAYNVGDVDEIGTSDVSAYVNQVKQILGVEA